MGERLSGIGVSYYAITQWNVASLQPPSLTTIVPWEGWADMYRDAVFHGGGLLFSDLRSQTGDRSAEGRIAVDDRFDSVCSARK